MNTQSAKAKGRKLQQHVRDKVLELFPDLTEDDIRSCPMGSNGMDLQLSSAAKATFPFSVECKARKAVSLVYDALEQAKGQDPVLTPLAVVKADRKRPLAVLDLDDLLALIEAAKGGR